MLSRSTSIRMARVFSTGRSLFFKFLIVFSRMSRFEMFNSLCDPTWRFYFQHFPRGSEHILFTVYCCWCFFSSILGPLNPLAMCKCPLLNATRQAKSEHCPHSFWFIWQRTDSWDGHQISYINFDFLLFYFKKKVRKCAGHLKRALASIQQY